MVMAHSSLTHLAILLTPKSRRILQPQIAIL